MLLKYIQIVFLALNFLMAVYLRSSFAEDFESNEIKNEEELSDNPEIKNEAQDSVNFSEYETLYGEDLSAVPFAVRYAYSNKTGKLWEKADYDQRGFFLRQWDLEEGQKRLNSERLRITEDQKAREKQLLKDLEKRREDLRITQKNREKERERMEEERKKQEFQQKIDRQKRALDLLRIKSERNHR